MSIVAEEPADETRVSVVSAVPVAIVFVSTLNWLVGSNTRLFSPEIPVKSTSPEPKELFPVKIFSLIVVESVALMFTIFPFKVEFPPPTDVRRHPPVGHDSSRSVSPSESTPRLFNLRRDEVDASVPLEALRFTLAPNVVLEPTVREELLPIEEFLFTLVPLIDSSSSPATSAGNSTARAGKVNVEAKAATHPAVRVVTKFFIVILGYSKRL